MEGPKGATTNPLRGLIPLEEPSLVSIHIGVASQGCLFCRTKTKELPVLVRNEEDAGMKPHVWGKIVPVLPQKRPTNEKYPLPEG